MMPQKQTVLDMAKIQRMEEARMRDEGKAVSPQRESELKAMERHGLKNRKQLRKLRKAATKLRMTNGEV